MIDLFEAWVLAVDTSVLTLIWLVQLVIYPGLSRYSSVELRVWHPTYTKRVSFVVLPLMLTQLVLSIYSVWATLELINIIHLGLVFSTWIITFTKAVPLHNSIEKVKEKNVIVQKLIRLNWYRTVLWTLTWGISIYGILS